MGYEEGQLAEDHLLIQLEKAGKRVTRHDTWYDFEVSGVRVEVKSCKLCIKKKGSFQMGRFHFNDEYNRDTQFNEDVWVCFLVRHAEQMITLGFVKAKSLKKKQNISIAQVLSLQPLDLDSWVKKVYA